ncbi:cryptochrome/photolyase family protein [Marinivivus vitaminiproducens]|uniref:cryptochrome/photolyase family protein n=1 Tax=Marinivivus vitaminiproducens TaxID=3035935 RepID=UPI0027A48143|nr:cryptochrome/photolyase family protein [Geminicoccaceae bacterium SCSIO 64248]
MSGGSLRFVLGDQLDRAIAALRGLDAKTDVVFLCEVADETTYVPHHPKKIAFLFSAMRHLAAELEADGVTVDYIRLDARGNTGSFKGELERAVKRHRPERVVVTHPGEYRVLADMRTWSKALGIPVEIREDDRFFCALETFAAWAEGRKQLRMELFYRDMRKQTGYLMDAFGEPVGNRWNFDAENRKPIPRNVETPGPRRFEPDAITRDVLDLVRERFEPGFGDVEGFGFAVTAADARKALAHFVRHGLARFGDYQDAMRQDEDFLFHSILSHYMNAGLLRPREVCDAVQKAYDKGDVPLNAAEGYIRQVIGWREYVRGIYWMRMPDYARENRLGAKRDLPDFYWGTPTAMNCLARVIDQTRREAHSHHIQRLMITGNFALLIGVEPVQICAWYLAVYADAYDWVELPNTLGMVMFADGGYLGSKPYAAGGNYINKMSDFCGSCAYDVRKKAGPQACPFNYLYWNFLIENREVLRGNQRLARVYSTLDRMSDDRKTEIRQDSLRFMAGLKTDEAYAPPQVQRDLFGSVQTPSARKRKAAARTG